MNLTEKLRRGIHSLESHTELRNYISEEEVVIKSYENLAKQKNEAIIFMGKSGIMESPSEDKDLFKKNTRSKS